MNCPDPTNMRMTRGDTTMWYFQRKDNDGDIITTPPTELYFSVKSNPRNYSVVFQKTLSDFTFDEDGTIHFMIYPEDTNNLDWKKQYWYDIETINEGVKTTIAYGKFTLAPEVTWAQNETEES